MALGRLRFLGQRLVWAHWTSPIYRIIIEQRHARQDLVYCMANPRSDVVRSAPNAENHGSLRHILSQRLEAIAVRLTEDEVRAALSQDDPNMLITVLMAQILEDNTASPLAKARARGIERRRQIVEAGRRNCPPSATGRARRGKAGIDPPAHTARCAHCAAGSPRIPHPEHPARRGWTSV